MKTILPSALFAVLLCGAALDARAQDCQNIGGLWTAGGFVDATFKAQIQALGVTETVWTHEQQISLTSDQTITLNQTNCSFSFIVSTTGSDGSMLTSRLVGSVSKDNILVSGLLPYKVKLPGIIGGSINFNGPLICGGPLVGGVIYLTNGVYTASTSYDGLQIQIVGKPNITLTAQFPLPPTVRIAAPEPMQRLTNAMLTVQGSAAANEGLQLVYYSLNNGPWTQTLSTDGWTNWSAPVTLTPGTNEVSVYAVDSEGTDSMTNSVTVFYSVKAPLSVQVVGAGTVAPNYAGQSLEINRSYPITAHVGKQSRFGNWSSNLSGLLTNAPGLDFVMQSNLILTANFIDIGPPVMSIRIPPNRVFASDSTFAVSGTAADNVAVAAVNYQLNGGDWTPAGTGNAWTNWRAASLNLFPGTNVFSAYAVDTSSNVSKTHTVTFDYVVTNALAIQVVGQGTFAPNYAGQLLTINSNYKMRAIPAIGFAFAGWSGGVPANTNASLTFAMSTNLAIIATFVDVARPVNAILFPTANKKWTNSVITVTGKAHDNVGVSNVWFQINTNDWAEADTINGFTNWSATNLTVIDGTNLVRAFAEDAAGNISLTNTIKFNGALP